jgi:transcriptional regulator with XRE-family HTH domain
MSIGQRVRERRQQLGLTQEEVAKALDVTPQHISAIELDQRAPSLDFLVKLAEYLGRTTDFLLTGKKTVICELLPVIKADNRLSLKNKNALITIVEGLYDKK